MPEAVLRSRSSAPTCSQRSIDAVSLHAKTSFGFSLDDAYRTSRNRRLGSLPSGSRFNFAACARSTSSRRCRSWMIGTRAHQLRLASAASSPCAHPFGQLFLRIKLPEFLQLALPCISLSSLEPKILCESDCHAVCMSLFEREFVLRPCFLSSRVLTRDAAKGNGLRYVASAWV